MKLSRRALTLGLLAAGCAPRPRFPVTFTSDAGLEPVEPLETEVTRVVIIGGGTAGLTVANALATAGVPQLVLEARDRLGGRVHSVDFGASSLDLGASWLHEPEGNPLSSLFDATGVSRTSFAISSLITDGTLWERNVGRVGELDKLRVLQALDGLDYEGLVARFASSAEVIDAGLARFEPVLRARARQIFDVIQQTENAAPLTNQAAGMITFEAPYGGDDLLLDGHYTQLIELLSNGVAPRLNAEVAEIARDASGCTVTLRDGSQERASHVVVTVPLGVLKAAGVRFSPALPDDKRAAIARLGFGHFEKLALEFPSRFWGELGSGFVVGDEAIPAFIDWTAHAHAPTLVVLSAGSYGAAFAAMSDEARVERAMELLRAVFGTNAPAPTRSVSTNWSSDPFARGAYSGWAVGSTLEDRDTLAAPTDGRLLFAGEATTRHRFATVDGAWSSGLREAQRLLRQRRVALTLAR